MICRPKTKISNGYVFITWFIKALKPFCNKHRDKFIESIIFKILHNLIHITTEKH